jgi:hypothetical protein
VTESADFTVCTVILIGPASLAYCAGMAHICMMCCAQRGRNHAQRLAGGVMRTYFSDVVHVARFRVAVSYCTPPRMRKVIKSQ